jgi:hypothetical protein
MGGGYRRTACVSLQLRENDPAAVVVNGIIELDRNGETDN